MLVTRQSALPLTIRIFVLWISSLPLTKFRLDIEYDYDFLLAGISCHEKPYRLCWAVNRALELNMERVDSLAIALKKGEEPTSFPLLMQENAENDTATFLVANKGERPDGPLLIPEQRQADYFFVAKGPFTDSDHERMLSEMKKIQFVLMSYRIDPETLKSKQNLLF